MSSGNENGASLGMLLH